MLKVIQNKSILDLDIKDNSIVIVNNSIYKYKEKYISKDILVTNKLSFMEKYSNKKLASNNIKFILMSNAFLNVKDNLLMYKDIDDILFTNKLLLTYDFYKENEVKNNDKYHDLKLIFDEYEKLIHENMFCLEYDLYELDIDKIDHDYIYFENINDLNNYDISLINRLKEKKEVVVFANTINNYSLINKLNKIDNIIYERIDNEDINNLFDISKKDLFSNIKIIACNDLYEEVKYILLDIKKKVNNGLKYKDILIISPDIKRYDSYFKMIFDIPYKKDINKGFLTKNFISILKSILDGNFSCLNFINLLKLDLLDFNKEDIYLLDNYIYMWDLEDKPFYEEFIYNPSGKKKLIENDNKILSKLNDIRLNITSLFKYLLENIKGVDAKEELLRYLFMFLDESKITEKLSLLDYDGYNKLVNIMEDLNDYMKESSNISTILDYIINLFETGNKQTNMQDEINISLLNMYDNNKYKMVYFIGLTEKDIPQKYNFNTLINENDIDDTYELIKNDSDLNNNLISNVLLNDNVIITYHKLNDDNKILSKSPLLNKFKNKEESFEYVVNKKINNDLDKKINNSLALKLYGEVLNLSPSGLEVLAKCKYSFFLNYGLKLKIKEKLVFDAREVGTFVHYILENAIKDKISVNEIEDKVNIYTNNYLTMNNYINGDINSFIIEELKKSTYILLEVIFDEISNTKLKPEKEELNLKDEPLSIKLDKGILNVSGIVDRLDSYIENNNYYFRIIDYKTGNKKFRLDDVLIGLNMQMLIYLTLIKENKKDINVIPTGFLYFPALVHYNKEYFNISEEEIINNIKSNIKMNGIVNCDYINLYNQNIDKFIDVTSRCKLNEEKVFSSSEIDNISSFVKKLLKEEVDSILNGDIRINPIKDNKNDSCAYCLFNSICKFNEKEDNYRKYKSLKNREALIKIEDILRK